MKRLRSLLTVVLPSVLAGGLVFGSAFTHAAGPDLVGFWPAAGDVTSTGARRGPPPPPPPTPPPDRDHWAVPPMSPPPPTPPTSPVRAVGAPRKGIRVTVRDGKVTVEGIADVVRAQLEAVRGALGSNPHIPRDVRDKVNARLDKVRTLVEKRAARMSTTDLEELGNEMEKMGEEVERALEGLDEDLAKLGGKLSKEIAKKLGKDLAKTFDPDKFHFDVKKDKKEKKVEKVKPPKKVATPAHDDDDNDGNDDHDDNDDHDSAGSDDEPGTPTVVGPPSADFKGVTLKPSQRAEIVKLRAESEKSIAVAQKELAAASQRLEVVLADPKMSERDVITAIDRVSAQEAAIRKARLLTWIQARKVLDADQRAKIEAAVAKKPGKH